MGIKIQQKEDLKREIVDCLSALPEVKRIVIFGSFLDSSEPRDLDIVVFQDSRQGYYPLAMKYGHLLKPVAKKITIDVIPIRPDPNESPFLREIKRREVLYER